MADTKRVGVPVTEDQEQNLQSYLERLARHEVLWDRVVDAAFGRLQAQAIRLTPGMDLAAPTTVPRLIATTAAIGLRVMERLAVDDAYAEGWAALNEQMRPDLPLMRERSQRALDELDSAMLALDGGETALTRNSDLVGESRSAALAT